MLMGCQMLNIATNQINQLSTITTVYKESFKRYSFQVRQICFNCVIIVANFSFYHNFSNSIEYLVIYL